MDLKKNIDDDLDESDPQLFGSLMYLVNTRIDSCHAVNVLSFHESTKTASLDNNKTCIKIYTRYGLRYASNLNLSVQDMSIQIEQKV